MSNLPPALFDELAGILAQALIDDLEAHPDIEENSPLAGQDELQSDGGPEGGRLQLVSTRNQNEGSA